MDLAYIFESFKALETNHEKVQYLKDLQKLNLGFDIRYVVSRSQRLQSYDGTSAVIACGVVKLSKN